MDSNIRFPVAEIVIEGSSANSSLRQSVTRRRRKYAQRGRFAPDSLLEGDGFELPVPEREDRVSCLGLLPSAHNQSDMSDRRMQMFGVDKSAEITVNWSMRFGSVSS